MYKMNLFALLIVLATLAPACSDLPAVHVDGANLVAGNQPIRLRGVDWGWWHLSGTQYTENDMRRQSAWGANLCRLVFSYGDLESKDHPGQWSEDGFKQFDDVIQWARKYNQYVILDMHVVPGGQDPSAYCDGGRNIMWTDPASQKNFFALWQEIARRYMNDPVVAAYEIMNEPDTRQTSPNVIVDVYRRAIAAVRTVDPKKVIVVEGDHYSSAPNLIDAMKMPDDNILYSFHFYDAATYEWLGNLTDGPGLSATKDWTELDQDFTPPANATAMSIMLRSSVNSGTAWFDDVKLTDDTGRIIVSAGFDHASSPFSPERGPESDMQYDSAVGHDAPGSLRVQTTTSYNGWQGRRIDIQRGRKYHLSSWIKLDNATGNSYLSVSFFGAKNADVDLDRLRKDMAPALSFQKKFEVPVWVGEFGCEASGPTGLQTDWVKACISLFERAGFEWSYWNYRETTGPTSMALQAETKDGGDYPLNEGLLSALRTGWILN